MIDLSLYVITDPHLSRGRSQPEVVRASLLGGATMIQLREKEASSLDFYQAAGQILTETRRVQVPLIINDRVDIALAVDADGVHVGQDDLKQLTGHEQREVGASIHGQLSFRQWERRWRSEQGFQGVWGSDLLVVEAQQGESDQGKVPRA